MNGAEGISPVIHLLFGTSGLSIAAMIWFASRLYSRVSYLEREVTRLREGDQTHWKRFDTMSDSIAEIRERVIGIEVMLNGGKKQ